MRKVRVRMCPKHHWVARRRIVLFERHGEEVDGGGTEHR